MLARLLVFTAVFSTGPVAFCNDSRPLQFDEQVWSRKMRLGQELRAKGRAAEAKEELLEAFEEAKTLPASDARGVTNRVELGLASASLGQYAEAERWDRDAIRAAANAYGESSLELTVPLTNLALVFRDQGKYAQAAENCQRALELLDGSQTDQPALRSPVLVTLGSIEFLRGRLREAEDLLARSIAIEEGLQPRRTNILAQALNDLAAVYRKAGRRAEALRALDRAYPLYESVYGPGHPDLFYIRSAAAALQADSGKYQEAVASVEDAVRLAEAGGAVNPAMVRDALHAEASWLRKLHCGDEAKKVEARAKSLAEAAAQNTLAQYTVDARDLRRTAPGD